MFGGPSKAFHASDNSPILYIYFFPGLHTRLALYPVVTISGEIPLPPCCSVHTIMSSAGFLFLISVFVKSFGMNKTNKIMIKLMIISVKPLNNTVYDITTVMRQPKSSVVLNCLFSTF